MPGPFLGALSGSVCVGEIAGARLFPCNGAVLCKCKEKDVGALRILQPLGRTVSSLITS